MLPSNLEFPGRRRRRATDPVNLALNYSYAILYGAVWRAVARAGLDPGVGFLHLAPRSSGGLIYDLVEELRAPVVDRMVFSLLTRGWQPRASGQVDEPASLRATDCGVLVRAWKKQMKRSMRRGRATVEASDLAWRQASLIRDVVLEKAPAYVPFRFRW